MESFLLNGLSQSSVRVHKRDGFKEIDQNVWRGYVDDLSFFLVIENNESHFPSNGGLRLTEYKNDQDALRDATTLSGLMSKKHSIYNTGFSGCKIVANCKNTLQNKKKILGGVGELLNYLEGKVYTGCDLNTNIEDMKFLSEITPYVISGVNSPINPSTATGYGIYGSILGLFENVKGKSFLVHGVGKTGSVVAQLLVENGATVFVCDTSSKSLYSVPGTQVSIKAWPHVEVDGLVLCSSSGIISSKIAVQLKCQGIVSGANNPFRTPDVVSLLNGKRIKWVPDPICNAGAVICDSIEFYNPSFFNKADPLKVYRFVQESVREKTSEYIRSGRNFSGEKIIGKLIG